MCWFIEVEPKAAQRKSSECQRKESSCSLVVLVVDTTAFAATKKGHIPSPKESSQTLSCSDSEPATGGAPVLHAAFLIACLHLILLCIKDPDSEGAKLHAASMH